MIKFSAVFVLLGTLACSSLTPSRTPANTRVLSPDATHGGPEYVCRIEMQYPRDPKDPSKNWRPRPYSVCTGTLISPTTVLTAGHCFETLLTNETPDLTPHGAVVRCGYDSKKGADAGMGMSEKGETPLTPEAFRVSLRAKSVAFDQRFEKAKGIFMRYSDTGAWDMAVLELERPVTEVKPAYVLEAGPWVKFAGGLIGASLPTGIFQEDGEAKIAKTIARKATAGVPGFNPQYSCQAAGYGFDLMWKNERLQSVSIPPETTGLRFTTPSAVVFSQTFPCTDAVQLPTSGSPAPENLGCPKFDPISSMGGESYEADRGKNIKQIYDRFPQAWDASWGDSGSPLLCRANSAEPWKVFGVLAGGSTERRMDVAGIGQTISIETFYTPTLGFKPGKIHTF